MSNDIAAAAAAAATADVVSTASPFTTDDSTIMDPLLFYKVPEERAPTEAPSSIMITTAPTITLQSSMPSSFAPVPVPVFTTTALFIIAFLVGFAIRLWKIRKDHQIDNDIDIANRFMIVGGGGGGGGNSGSGINKDIKFALEDRIELYSKTFDSNGNQLILEKKHIETKARSTATSTTNDDGNYDEKNNNVLFVDIELNLAAENKLAAEGNDHINNHDDVGLSDYLSVELSERILTRHLDDDDDIIKKVMHSSTESLCLHLDHHHHHNDKVKQMISGTCIICFEEFVITDVIVWSENPKCSHVYHKECMVNYLASNAQRKINSTLDVNDNPCPACRQNYCTVKLMVQKVSITTTSKTTTTAAAAAAVVAYPYPIAMSTTMADAAVAET